jgi:hypothetical protein
MNQKKTQISNPITNIAVIRGNSAKVNNGRIIYTPSRTEPEHKEVQNGNGEKPVDRVMLRSDVRFSSGELEFSLVERESDKTEVIVVFYSTEGHEIHCGYSRRNKTFLICEIDGNRGKTLAEGGNLANYDLDQAVKFQISIKGSQINLFINEICLCSAIISVKDSPVEFLIESIGKFEIHDIIIHAPDSKKSAFVVMQFTEEYDDLYEDVIKPVTEQFGYECVRADKLSASTPILNDIIQSIRDSSVVVAEITPDNPNVFYEIGYSHAIGTPTILLCDRKREKLPFDISGFRTIFYENTIAGKKNVENNLMKYLERIKIQQQKF